MSRYDSIVSSEAWDRLVSDYRELERDGGDSDFEVAELLRRAIEETEGLMS